MAGAQDQAFAALVTSRGLVSAEDLDRSGAVRDPEPLAQALARRRLMSARAVAGILRDLARMSFGCSGCNARFSYDSLARLEQLRCPGCGEPIEAAGYESTLSWPAANAADSQAARGSALGSVPFPRASHESGTGSIQLGPDGTLRDAAPGEAPTVGGRLGPYRLIELLGRGSYGAVYLAERPGLERRFAVKVLLDSEVADDESVARFQLEAAVASKITDPGAVSAFDVGRVGDHLYYVMEYCPGQNLKQHLKEVGKLPPVEAARLVRDVAQTMVATHAKGVIHRDLKPSNIIMDHANGRPRVTDFGLARDRSLLRSMTQSGDILGTPHYMSPEQFRGQKDLDHRIDVYALGVILYECLTGERPHTAETAVAMAEKVCNERPQDPCELEPSISRQLADITLKAMEIHPDDRYGSAAELVADLERHLRGERPEASRTTPRGAIAVAVTLIVLTTAAVSVAVVQRISRDDPTAQTNAPPPTQPVTSSGSPASARRLIEQVEALAGKRAPWSELLPGLNRAKERAGDDAQLTAEVDLLRLRLLLRRGRAQEAVTWAGQLLDQRSAPNNEVRALLAEAYERSEHVGEALTLYGRLVDEDDGVRGRCAQAALYRRQGEHVKAVKAAEQALTRSEDDLSALIEHGLAKLETNDLDHAEQSLSRAKELAPDEPRVLFGLGRLRLQESKPDSGRRMLEEALELVGDEPAATTRALYGYALNQAGQPEDARRVLDGVLERDPAFEPALLHRGALLDSTGDTEGSRRDWSKAYESNAMLCQRLMHRWYPKQVVARFERAAIGDARSEEDQRDEFFQLGVIREPVVKRHFRERLEGLHKFARADLEKAIFRAAKGEPWENMEHPIRSARRIARKDPRVQLEHVRLLLTRDRHDEAQRELGSLRSHAAKLPTDALAWIEAELALRSGALGDAQDRFGRLATRSRDPSLAAAAKAQALWLGGLHGDALRSCAKALAKRPHHIPTLALQSMCLFALGRPKEALAPLRAAYERVGASDSRLLALRAVLIMEFRGTRHGGNTWAFALQSGMDIQRVFEHLTISDGTFCRRLACQLALYSKQLEPRSRAEMLLRELNALEPTQPHTLLALGYARLLDGQVSAATTRWQRARELAPNLPFPAPYLSEFEARGGEPEALEAFRRR